MTKYIKVYTRMKNETSGNNSLLKVKFASFFIGVSDAPEYENNFTETGDEIDRFILKILTFMVGKVSPFVLAYYFQSTKGLTFPTL